MATLIYTSGTTGDPKAVEITHANLLAQVDAFDHILDIRFGDRAIYGGQGLNIVAMSYADTLQFTFTACGARLPDVERLTELCRQALDSLEAAICDAVSDLAR